MNATLRPTEPRDLPAITAIYGHHVRTGDSGNAPSIGIHSALGFAMVGTFRSVGWKHERWVDTVHMQRAIGAGGSRVP